MHVWLPLIVSLTVFGCNPRLFFLSKQELISRYNLCVMRSQADPGYTQQQCRPYLQELHRRGEKIGEAPVKVIDAH